MGSDFAKKNIVLSNGLNIAYLEVGTAGPLVLWVHGMGSYRETFHTVLSNPPMAARHVALDLPGFGDSTHLPQKHTLADYADSVNEFLERMGETRVLLAGHSFGGMVVGETVARYPERAYGAILISSAGWIDPVNALTPTPFFFLNRIVVWLTGTEWFGRRMLNALGVNPATVSAGDRRRLQYGWRRAYEMARMGAFYHSPRFADRVLAAGPPIAIIHGGRDALFPLTRVRTEINERAPLWAIAESGHVPFLSHPELFSQAFREAFFYIQTNLRSGTR